MSEMKVTCRLSTQDDGTTKRALGDAADSFDKAGRSAESAGKKSTEAGEKIAHAAERIGDMMRDLAVAVGLGFSIEKITGFVDASLEGAQRIQDLSETVGIGTQALQTMAYVAKTSGANLDSLVESVSRLERAQVEARDGNLQTAEAFRAVGVSIQDLKKLSPEQLLQKTAAGVSALGSYSTKTAVAMELLGRGAASNLPFIQRLGEGMDDARKSATDLGFVLSGAEQAALVGAKEQLNQVAAAGEGLANRFTIALLPAINAVSAEMVTLSHNGTDKALLDGFGRFVADIVVSLADWWAQFKKDSIDAAVWWKTMTVDMGASWQNLKDTISGKGLFTDAKEWLQGVGTAITAATSAAQTGGFGYSAALSNMGKATDETAAKIDAITAKGAALKAGIDADTAAFHTNTQATNEMGAAVGAYFEKLGSGDKSEAAHVAALQSVAKIADQLISKGGDYNLVVAREIDQVARIDAAFDKATGAQGHYNSQVDQSAQLEEKRTALLSDSARVIAALSAQMGGADARALGTYADTILAAVKAFQDMRAKGLIPAAQANDILNTKVKLATDLLNLNSDAQRKNADELAKSATALQTQVALWDVIPEQQAAVRAGLDAYNVAMISHRDLLGNVIPDEDKLRAALAAQIPQYVANKQALEDVTAAQQYANQQAQAYRQIEVSGLGDIANAFAGFAGRQIKSWHDLWKTLIGDAQNFVVQMLATYLRLEVLQPFVANLMGWGPSYGGGSVGGMATAAIGTVAQQAATSALSGGAQSVVGGGGAGSAGISPYASVLGSMGRGSTLGGQYWSAAGNSISGLPGALWNGTGIAGSNMFGASAITTNADGMASGMSYTPSTLGNVLGIVGGIYAGYNEFKAAGGGAAGLAGGVAYGLGTITAAGAIGGIATGAGAAAGAAGGLGAVGLGAIPIVGWIALAAMALNMITKGGLFGTGWQVTGATQAINIGAAGGSAETILSEKKKKPLFQGSSYKDVTHPGTPEENAVAQKIFDSVTHTMEKAAGLLGIAVPEIVEGSFKSLYDKKGKLTSQQSEILGQVYKETFEDFAKRITAENVIRVVETAAASATGASSDVAAQLDSIAAKWRANADTLLDGAQLMLQVQSDLQKGNNLLGAGATIVDVVNEVISQARDGETMLATYQRLEVATEDLRNALDVMGVDIGKTGAQFVDFAAAIAEAAGGLQNAEQLWASFFQHFYGASDLLKGQVAALTKKTADALNVIGEDAGVSLDQFKADFLAALPTLTPDQVVEWLTAAQYLAQLSDSATQLADASHAASLDLQQALATMGVDIGKTSDQFSAFADELADAAGGVANAEKLWSSFFQSFYSSADSLGAQVKILQQESASALAAIGESSSVSMQQFREDFEAALPNLSADQVVQWLKAGNLLAQLTNATSQFASVLNPTVASADEFIATMQAIVDATNATTAAARARGVSESQLGYTYYQAQQRILAAVQILKAQTQDLIAQLYGGVGGTLDEVNAQIQAIESSNANASQSIDNVDTSLQDTFRKWMDGLKGVQDFLDNLLTNTQLTTLTPEQQLAAARAQYQDTLEKAKKGDTDALSKLPGLSQAYLQQARGYYSSGDAYTQIFDMLRADLGGLSGLNKPGNGNAGGGGGGGGTFTVGVSAELQALFDKQATLEAQATANNRLQLAVDLEQHLRDLAKAINVPVLELAGNMGVSLQKLATDVGVDLKNLDENSVEALAGMAGMLGVNLGDLVSSLGLNLTDLGGGLAELATSVGINLSDLSKDTAGQLAALAVGLGTNLDTITRSLGIDLGKLADAQSAINKALGDQITRLPKDEKEALLPLFNAIKDATNDADANAAIAALEAAVAKLPAGDRDLLAPYFKDLLPNKTDPTTQALYDANAWLRDIRDWLSSIYKQLGGVVIAGHATGAMPAGGGSYAVGSSFIQSDQTAEVHRGEIIVDPQSADVLRRYGIGLAVSTPTRGDGTVDQVRALRDDLDEQSAATLAAVQSVERALREVASAQRDANRLAELRAQQAAFSVR